MRGGGGYKLEARFWDSWGCIRKPGATPFQYGIMAAGCRAVCLHPAHTQLQNIVYCAVHIVGKICPPPIHCCCCATWRMIFYEAIDTAHGTPPAIGPASTRVSFHLLISYKNKGSGILVLLISLIRALQGKLIGYYTRMIFLACFRSWLRRRPRVFTAKDYYHILHTRKEVWCSTSTAATNYCINAFFSPGPLPTHNVQQQYCSPLEYMLIVQILVNPGRYLKKCVKSCAHKARAELTIILRSKFRHAAEHFIVDTSLWTTRGSIYVFTSYYYLYRIRALLFFITYLHK